MAGCGDFAAVVGAAVDLGERFFADFGIGILHSVYGAVAPHHRNPTSANKPAGAGFLGAYNARTRRQYRSNGR